MCSIEIEKNLQCTRSKKDAALINQCNHPRRESLFDIMKLIGISAKIKNLDSDIELYSLLRKGLPNKVLRSLTEKTGFNLEELSTALAISRATLQARLLRVSRRDRLSSSQSATVWQLASVFVLAQSVMGSREQARCWLCTEARSLRYQKPIEYLALWPGAEFVSKILRQIDACVYL